MSETPVFKPVPKVLKIKPDRHVYALHMPIALAEELSEAAKKTGLTKQELVRQMIKYCCKHISYFQKEEITREDF